MLHNLKTSWTQPCIITFFLDKMPQTLTQHFGIVAEYFTLSFIAVKKNCTRTPAYSGSPHKVQITKWVKSKVRKPQAGCLNEGMNKLAQLV
jgi:hypothetical protein